MISGRLYNNIGIEALSLAFVIGHKGEISVSKAMLVPPIIAHSALLLHLARNTTNITSFERYLIENVSNFSNFGDRYYDGLVNSMNAVQLLSELEIVSLSGSTLRSIQPLEYRATMGKRAGKIIKATPNISKLIQGPVENLYLNLRIEL